MTTQEYRNEGFRLMNGEECEPDFDRARDMFLKAVEAGDAPSAAVLGSIDFDNEDYKSARKWFGKAIELFGKAGKPEEEKGYMGYAYHLLGMIQYFNYEDFERLLVKTEGNPLDWMLNKIDIDAGLIIQHLDDYKLTTGYPYVTALLSSHDKKMTLRILEPSSFAAGPSGWALGRVSHTVPVLLQGSAPLFCSRRSSVIRSIPWSRVAWYILTASA